MFLCGSRQCRLQANAAGLHVPWREGCGADGLEHCEVQGHSRATGMQAVSGETLASYAGRVGFVFTTENLTEIKDLLLVNEVAAASGAKAIASCEVSVPTQITGLESKKPSSFQASGLTTKLSRGTFETLIAR